MSATDDAPSPWTRPQFLASAVLVSVLVVAGILIMVTQRDDASTSGQATTVAGPDVDGAGPTGTARAEDTSPESACGLPGVVESGRITAAPDAAWDYEGTTAYPVSAVYGPAEVDPDGIRTCFQHSPEGALFWAANAIAQGSGKNKQAWADHAVSEGPYRDRLMQDDGAGENGSDSRTRVAGFRLLSYAGSTAQVDIAVTVTTSGEVVTMSCVYSMVWRGGDWKIDSDAPDALSMVQIPGLSGYILWSE